MTTDLSYASQMTWDFDGEDPSLPARPGSRACGSQEKSYEYFLEAIEAARGYLVEAAVGAISTRSP